MRLRDRLRRFGRDETGASLVEFSLVVLLFLFLLFAIIDFGRIANAWVGANKATQIAARIAAVRPPACPGVPAMTLRNPSFSLSDPSLPTNFGTACRRYADGNDATTNDQICFNPWDDNDPSTIDEVSCSGTATNSTANEVFAAVRPLLPPGTVISNLRFRYVNDENLGFLGGPYVPMVTVELTGIDFTFVSQLGQFIRFLTGKNSNLGADLPVPGMSVSLPGEDLAQGTAG
jgi:Flp pilus assembly pilin Flp